MFKTSGHTAPVARRSPEVESDGERPLPLPPGLRVNTKGVVGEEQPPSASRIKRCDEKAQHANMWERKRCHATRAYCNGWES